jgi:hypothetical protein
MSLITNQKIKNLQSEIDDLKETIQTLSNSIITINNTKPKYYSGFTPLTTIQLTSTGGRTSSFRMLDDTNSSLTTGVYIDIPPSTKLTIWYGLNAYKNNGAVGSVRLRFDVFDINSNSWVDFGTDLLWFCDPTQNQESKSQSVAITTGTSYKFQNISIIVISANTVIDSGCRPYFLMRVELPD